VNKDTASLLLALVDEIDSPVEAALDVLSGVVLKMETQVLDALVQVVFCRVVGGTVDDMSNLVFVELIIVLSHVVTSKVDELV
jgi:hypothetical protein